jgi:hypothetical protein
MAFTLGLILGGVSAAFFVAYRLRGERTFVEAVTEVVTLGGPPPRTPR